MSSMKEYMQQRKLQRQSGATEPKLAAQPPKKAAPKKQASQEMDPKLTVTFSCGHKAGVRLLQGTPCTACARYNQKRRNQEKNARQQEKKAQREDRGRLPDGAAFSVRYDAETVLWTGLLTIGDVVFTGQGSSLWKLLAALDDQYRQSLVKE